MKLLFEELSEIYQKPELFSAYTAETLWTEPHLAQQMLKTHLDQNTPLASRTLPVVDQTVAWLDDQIGLDGKKVCDLGCGPGLYAERYAQSGAFVEGLDFSANSIAYAIKNATSDRGSLSFRRANYLIDELPAGQDLITLIYCDFCPLSPSQRSILLSKVRNALLPNGAFVFDVCSTKAFEEVSEGTVLSRNQANGFWTTNDCFVFQSTWCYPTDAVSLDLFTIVEEGKIWRIYNWLQYFSPESIQAELQAHGFKVENMSGGFGANDETADTITIVARPLQTWIG